MVNNKYYIVAKFSESKDVYHQKKSFYTFE